MIPPFAAAALRAYLATQTNRDPRERAADVCRAAADVVRKHDPDLSRVLEHLSHLAMTSPDLSQSRDIDGG